MDCVSNHSFTPVETGDALRARGKEVRNGAIAGAGVQDVSETNEASASRQLRPPVSADFSTNIRSAPACVSAGGSQTSVR